MGLSKGLTGLRLGLGFIRSYLGFKASSPVRLHRASIAFRV